MSHPGFSHRILYYPHIEFVDETWLKTAILIWDKIYRIVPRGYSPKDSDEVRQAIESGYVIDINLEKEDLKQAADDFIHFSERLPFIPSGFHSSTYEVRLHENKIDSRIIDYFRERSTRDYGNGFLKIDGNIANGYMFYLSSIVSKRRSIQKVTDDPDMYAAMTYFDYQGNFDETLEDEKSKEGIINIIVENMIPSDIKFIKMETIKNIESKNSESKKLFREKISKLANEVSKIEDYVFMKEVINDYKNELLKIGENRKKNLLEYSKELVPSFLFVGLPVLANAYINAFSSSENGFISGNKLAEGFALSGVATLAQNAIGFRKKWEERNNNYLLQIHSHLYSSYNVKLHHANISHLLEEYIND